MCVWRVFVFVFSHLLVMPDVSKDCLNVCMMGWNGFQTGLTFSYLSGGWWGCSKTEVNCCSDPLSQLWDSTVKVTGLCYPRPYLVFDFPTSPFSVCMALYSICPSTLSHINTTRWVTNGLTCNTVFALERKEWKKSNLNL